MLKPLADAGSLYIGHISSRSRHPSLNRLRFDREQVINVFQTRFPDLSAELTAKPGRYGGNGLDETLIDVINVVRLAAWSQGRANAMACNDYEYKVMTSLLREAEVDRKYWTLATLTQMNVPRLQGKIDELVTIRRSDDAFNLWREALSTALVQIQRIPRDRDKWQEDANSVLFSELEPLRLKLQRAASKSPVLTAMHMGASKISIAGAGALSGWAAAVR